MSELRIYRQGVEVLKTSTDSPDFNGQVMGENKITAQLFLFEPFKFRIGDYITHRGRQYSISEAPTEKKTGNRRYAYILIFEAPEYKLYNTKFRHLNSGTFSFTANCSDMIDLVVGVAGSAWSRGTIASTAILTAQFDKDSCRTAITKIAELFGLEFEFTATNAINVVESVGNLVVGAVFEYGMGKGLYDLTRQPIANNTFGTRFYGYGGNANLPAGYRGGATQLQFEGFFVDSPNHADFDQIIERDAEFPDIFPQRTGTITAQAETTNGWSVTDSSMDFDLNDTIVDGAAKIVFKTGSLTGNEFEITRYNATTKVITFNVNREESGYVLPNTTVKPSVGDTYTFVGIVMPQSYIDVKEAELKAKTIEYALNNSTPKISYALTIDELFMRNHNMTQALTFGDKIRVIDADMGVDVILRIQQISYPIFNEGKVTATITDTVTYSMGEKLIVDVKNNEQEIINESRANAQRAISRDISLRELQNYVIDPEGNYYTEKITPGSIETLYLAVGSKYTNFALKGVTFNVNNNGNPNELKISAGQLVHFAINIEGVGFTWNMSALDVAGLVPASTYYLYAKVSRTALIGEWILSTDIKGVESEAGVWYFQTGVLFNVIDGYRNYELTKGMAYIIGDQITAGIIKSLDGLNYFNLTDGKFSLGDADSGIDYNVTTGGTLTIRGTVVATNAEFINLFIQNLKTSLTGKRLEITKAGNNLSFYVDEGLQPALKIDADISSAAGSTTSAGVQIITTEGSSYMTGSGILSNGSGTGFVTPSSGLPTNASIVGYLNKRLNTGFADGISAGVAAIDNTTNLNGDSQSYALYALGGVMLGGAQYVKYIELSANYTANDNDYMIACTGLSPFTVHLPNQKRFSGRIIQITNILNAPGNITVNGNGASIFTGASTSATYSLGGTKKFVFDGSKWVVIA